MSFSGFILYVAPPSRIAYWHNWRLIIFSKEEWQALHTIFSFMFFILFVIHLFYINWKAFLSYIKSKVRAGLNKKWELASSIVISSIFFIGTLDSWIPFGPVMAFGTKVKNSWEKSYINPPVSHMEAYTIEKIAQMFQNVTVDDLLNLLDENNIKVARSDETLKEIGSKNKIAPAKIYEIISGRYGEAEIRSSTGAGTGMGKITLKQVAKEKGQDMTVLLTILKDRGIDATPQTTLKEIASKLGISAQEAYSILTNQ